MRASFHRSFKDTPRLTFPRDRVPLTVRFCHDPIFVFYGQAEGRGEGVSGIDVNI